MNLVLSKKPFVWHSASFQDHRTCDWGRIPHWGKPCQGGAEKAESALPILLLVERRSLAPYSQQMPPETFPLIKWDAVESAIQRAQSISDLNGLRSRIETLHVLSKQSRQSLSTQNKIASYRLRVDRKRGEWLLENIVRAGNGSNQHSKKVLKFPRVTLATAGITNKESHILQRIASIPEEVFRKHLVSTLRDGEELTTASVLRLDAAIRFDHREPPAFPKGTLRLCQKITGQIASAGICSTGGREGPAGQVQGS